jgi:RimJ/RimL family protein N-acetyltransferase
MIEIQPAAGGRVGLALLEQSDREALRRLFFRLSPETLYRRFHSPIVRPEQTQPDRLLDIDHHDREAVVAVVGQEIVGVARYVRRRGTDSAEVALVVADDWHRQGLATRMLGALHERAKEEGVQRFTLTMQADNRKVLQLFRRFYPGLSATCSQGMCEAEVAVAR